MWKLLIYFSCLINLVNTSSTTLKSSGKSRPPCLVPNLRGKAFSLSQLRMMFTVYFFIWLLLRWGSFLVCFIIKELDFFKFFSASIEMIMCFFFPPFILLMWDITFIGFAMLDHPYIPEINFTCPWYIIFLICCWILFASIFLRTFCRMFIGMLICSFLFLLYLCLWYQGYPIS